MKLPVMYRFIAIVFIIVSFTGCLKDTCKENYQIFIPVYKTLTEVRADMKSGKAREIENPGKIFTIGHYIFVNEINRGVHVIDNADPSHPKKISFINIPGNEDLAVQNNTLYADSYSDLVALDITSVTNISAKKFIPNVFQDRNYFYAYNSSNHPDSVRIIVDYLVKDTVMDCDSYDRFYNCRNCAFADARQFAQASSAPKPVGKGGSMARFALLKNHLYTVTRSDLSVFGLSQPLDPQLMNTQKIGSWNIETIFPFQNKLFIGSTTGMFIFDVTNPSAPAPAGQFSHIRRCDPVIADEKHAFVTLRTGNLCVGNTNQLDILNIQNSIPVLIKSYPLTNPHGLSKEGNILFVCDGPDGIKVYDASNVQELKLLSHIQHIDSYDVITNGTIALVVGKEGLYQFQFADPRQIRLLSQIKTGKGSN